MPTYIVQDQAQSSSTRNLKYWVDTRYPHFIRTEVYLRFLEILKKAREYVVDDKVPVKTREECVTLLGGDPSKQLIDLEILYYSWTKPTANPFMRKSTKYSHALTLITFLVSY
jgi:hypothetical protein